MKDLEAGAGRARTAGGTRIPLPTLIRWAANAHHYLAVFDRSKPPALFHTKRLANRAPANSVAGQRRWLHQAGLQPPGYHTQVHHTSGWTNTHVTDIHHHTLACGPDNRLAERGWTTRKNANSDTEWIPPAHLDHGQPRINTFHHPERLFAPEDDEPGRPTRSTCMQRER